MKAVDILAEQEGHTERNGIIIRKGSVAAFLANAELLQNTDLSAQQKAQIIADIQELMPALIAIKLFDVLAIRSAAGQPDYFARQAPPSEGSSSSMTCSCAFS